MSFKKSFMGAVQKDDVLLALISLRETEDINALVDKYPTLVFAINENAMDVAFALINAGADINMAGACGNTPLHVAVLSGNKNLIEQLVCDGAEVNKQNKDGRTPLHYASEAASVEVVSYLIDHGANVLARDNKGFRPSYQANKRGRIPTVKLLIKKELSLSDN